MAENPNSRQVITTTTSPYLECGSSATAETPWYDKQSMRRVPEYLILVEVVLGMLVWILIASTEYFRFSPFGWVMFVSVFFWVLTLFLLILSLTKGQIRQKPLTTMVLVFNCSATVMYMSAAIVEAALIARGVKGRHNYSCWTASTFFAFLISLTYAGSAFLGFKGWHRTNE